MNEDGSIGEANGDEVARRGRRAMALPVAGVTVDDHRPEAWRHTLLITLACMAGSVAITAAVTYVATGTLNLGLGIVIALLAPAVLVPIGSYSHISMSMRLREANERLRRLSETDPLTGICNRRRFMEVAEGQLALARRYGFPTSLLLIDFDRFKEINDRLGHLTGDQVLVEGCRTIHRTLRESDTLARFGGEEFIALLPHTAREGALMVADRIVSAIRGNDFRVDERSIGVTASIGGVTCETSETSLEALISKADDLMYAAKRAGRDRYLVEGLPRQVPLPFRDAVAPATAAVVASPEPGAP